ncbi:MAG: type IV toxin-antitoxin system AbiEi family antitoxin domain-containing protein [Solirubrobacteraceae bacterium]
MSELAGRQFGLVTTEQLMRLGLTARQIRSWVDRGLLHQIHKDVFAVGHPRLTSHGRLLAAQLTCGDHSFLSHRTAAAVWDLRAVNVRRIEVTVPESERLERTGLVVHCTAHVGDDEVRTRNGLRVSSVPRMLLELANCEAQAELERLITEAVRRRALDFKSLEQTLTRHTRRPGLANLRRALHDYRPGPNRKSDLERAFDRLIKDTDIPPPERNVYIGGWEIDCYWPEFKLVVELDGRNYHSSLADMERDRKKDGDLLKLGIGTFRITDLRFELEPEEILADLRTLTT